jgi:hypothetical protein
MGRGKKALLGVLVGLGLLGGLLSPSPDATRPLGGVGIAIPTGLRLSDVLEPDHGHEERPGGPPREYGVRHHLGAASASMVNADAAVSIVAESQASVHPLVPLTLAFIAAWVVVLGVGVRLGGARTGSRFRLGGIGF